MRKNQSGFSMISLLLSLIIISIVALLLMKAVFKQGSGVGKDGKTAASESRDAKTLAIAMECRESIRNLAMIMQSYSTSSDESSYPSSFSELAEHDPAVNGIIGNTALWTDDGYPKLDASFSGTFRIVATCRDGFSYEYKSEVGAVEAMRENPK